MRLSLQDQAVKNVEKITVGWFFAKNDMKTGGQLTGVTNPRGISRTAVVRLAQSLTLGADRSGSPLVYACRSNNAPEGLATTAGELAYVDETTYFVEFKDPNQVWRLAGNHRVQANELLRKRIARDHTKFTTELEALATGPETAETRAQLVDGVERLAERLRDAGYWPARLILLSKLYCHIWNNERG